MQTRPEFPVPTRADQYDFLLLVYFGSEKDHLGACVHRAYRDLNRTLHGLAQLPDAVKLSTRASAEVRSALVELATSAGVSTQAGFDAWHRDACAHLCALHAENGFPLFCVGHAQKPTAGLRRVHGVTEVDPPPVSGLGATRHRVPLMAGTAVVARCGYTQLFRSNFSVQRKRCGRTAEETRRVIVPAPMLRLLEGTTRRPKDRRMTMPVIKTPNKTLLTRTRPGTWVAISQNEERVVSTGRTLSQVLRRAKKNGEKSPFILRVPKPNSALIL